MCQQTTDILRLGMELNGTFSGLVIYKRWVISLRKEQEGVDGQYEPKQVRSGGKRISSIPRKREVQTT